MGRSRRVILAVLIRMAVTGGAAVGSNATGGLFDTIRQDPLRLRIIWTTCV